MLIAILSTLGTMTISNGIFEAIGIGATVYAIITRLANRLNHWRVFDTREVFNDENQRPTKWFA